MGSSLLEAAAASFDFPSNGSTCQLRFLSYRDQSEIVAETVRREKESVLADAKAAGITGEPLYAKLREVDATWAGDDAFVRCLFRREGQGLDHAFRRVLRKTYPDATDEQIESTAAAMTFDDHLAVVKRAANLKDKPAADGGQPPDPQSGAATGSAASPA